MTRARGWNDAGSGLVSRKNARSVRFCGFGARRDARRGGFSSLAHLGFRVAVDGVYEQKVGRSPLLTTGNVLARRDEREGLDHPRCWLNVFAVSRSSAILSFVHPSA